MGKVCVCLEIARISLQTVRIKYITFQTEKRYTVSTTKKVKKFFQIGKNLSYLTAKMQSQNSGKEQNKNVENGTENRNGRTAEYSSVERKRTTHVF